MTRSELFAVMAGGMASVAGSVLGGYAGLGVDLKYLIAASFMAAPGSLMMAKIIVPERQTPSDYNDIELDKSEESNVIDALASGAMGGMKVAVAVGTMLIAFVSVIAMVNTGLENLGDILGFSGVTLQAIFGLLVCTSSVVDWCAKPRNSCCGFIHWSESCDERVCCVHRFCTAQSDAV